MGKSRSVKRGAEGVIMGSAPLKETNTGGSTNSSFLTEAPSNSKRQRRVRLGVRLGLGRRLRAGLGVRVGSNPDCPNRNLNPALNPLPNLTLHLNLTRLFPQSRTQASYSRLKHRGSCLC